MHGEIASMETSHLPPNEDRSFDATRNYLYENISHEPNIISQQPSCIHCGAKKFQYEPKGFCCKEGKVHLRSTPVPEELYDLYTSTTREAVEFRRHIRSYNSHFSFTSLGVTLDKDLYNMRSGVYTFRAQGQMYHFIDQLLPRSDGPKYLQLYYYDIDFEIRNRLEATPSLNGELIKKIVHILANNPYAQFFRSLNDFEIGDDFKITISKDVKLDQQVYNVPTSSQVAGIWVEGNDCNGTQQRNIIVHAHSGESLNVQSYFGCYDPLSYPLVFPNGDVGWHRGLPKDGFNIEDVMPITRRSITNVPGEDIKG